MLRYLLGALVLLTGILGVNYLQFRFDRGDERKALQAVQSRFPDLTASAACRTEMASRLKGAVRVVCGERAWVVNVLEGTIAEEAHAP